MKKYLLLIAVFAAPSFAVEVKGTPQTHHCMKAGAVVEVTKRECKKEGGTWEKMAKAAPADPAAAPPKPAEAPAPAPAPLTK